MAGWPGSESARSKGLGCVGVYGGYCGPIDLLAGDCGPYWLIHHCSNLRRSSSEISGAPELPRQICDKISCNNTFLC